MLNDSVEKKYSSTYLGDQYYLQYGRGEIDQQPYVSTDAATVFGAPCSRCGQHHQGLAQCPMTFDVNTSVLVASERSNVVAQELRVSARWSEPERGSVSMYAGFAVLLSKCDRCGQEHHESSLCSMLYQPDRATAITLEPSYQLSHEAQLPAIVRGNEAIGVSSDRVFPLSSRCGQCGQEHDGLALCPLMYEVDRFTVVTPELSYLLAQEWQRPASVWDREHIGVAADLATGFISRCDRCGGEHHGLAVCPMAYKVDLSILAISEPLYLSGQELQNTVYPLAHKDTDITYDLNTTLIPRCTRCGGDHYYESVLCPMVRETDRFTAITLDKLDVLRVGPWQKAGLEWSLGQMPTDTWLPLAKYRAPWEISGGVDDYQVSEHEASLAAWAEALEERVENLETLLDAVGLRAGTGELRLSQTARSVEERLGSQGLYQARREVCEAVRDILRAPDSDQTGAIQHAVAGFESAAQAITGRGLKLSTLLQVYADEMGLDETLASKLHKEIWQYGSRRGRHIQEGYPPTETRARQLVWLTLEALDCMLCAHGS